MIIIWSAARTIAVTLASRTEPAPVVPRFDYRRAVDRAAGPVAEFTGMRLPEERRSVRVVGRAEWIDLNLHVFARVLEPVLRRAERESGGLTRAAGSMTITAQVGVLLGFLSSRVLGQYDAGPLVVPREGPGDILFLDGNIRATARRLGVPLDALRLWIVLHEMTHAFQFEAHPWLREHLGEMLQELLAPLAERVGAREFLRRLVENGRRGGRALELVMSRGQRESFERLQAAMALVEGYSDYVMHGVGSALVPRYGEIQRKIRLSRMRRPPLESAIFRLTGLDLKLEQYRLGEEFVEAVARRQGMEGVNRVWERPANLPTLREIHDPALWMLRMEEA
ncbi:hypothetical protein E0L93_00985 [Rubrobacter taiwanensis]|uniref:Coenzyme F420 biosynthesis-associated protein n=1 Tax=Rubrobacter taiwanensis TaxID=185139 RepID=A0A4R1BSK6_9ACTN|nr:zinc-dependent metalloprotease [Rubrobacter taiwanensis]TCJ20618.1 hypothetical protein E0L93_00985 [Rubrobacter taiwanensis]